MTKDEALKMAIEAMTSPNNLSFLMAITACKEALEQPSVAELNDEYLRDTHVEGLSQPTQEPVAWLYEDELPSTYPYEVMFEYSAIRNGVRMFPVFYPAPSWQGLSDDEIWKFALSVEKFKPAHGVMLSNEWNILEFARAIEQALKEKNK